MPEEIRVYLMKIIVAHREPCDQWTVVKGSRIQKILDKNSKLTRMNT